MPDRILLGCLFPNGQVFGEVGSDAGSINQLVRENKVKPEDEAAEKWQAIHSALILAPVRFSDVRC
jgi:hypothetical protein